MDSYEHPLCTAIWRLSQATSGIYYTMTTQIIQAKSIKSEAVVFLGALRSGFLSAVSTYLHQSLTMEDTLPQLADLLSDMAETEIAHYHAIGGCIAAFGADPTPVVQSRGAVSLPPLQSPKEIIRNGISECRRVIALLNSITGFFCDSEICDILKAITATEESHIEALFGLYGECS